MKYLYIFLCLSLSFHLIARKADQEAELTGYLKYTDQYFADVETLRGTYTLIRDANGPDETTIHFAKDYADINEVKVNGRVVARDNRQERKAIKIDFTEAGELEQGETYPQKTEFKVRHIVQYTPQAILLAFCLQPHIENLKKRTIMAIAGVTLIGISTDIIQIFILSRIPAILDVFWNFFAAILGGGFYFLFKRSKK